jgi:hypothetical protein
LRARLFWEPLEDRTLLAIGLLGIPAWNPQGPAPIVNGTSVLAGPDNSASGAVAAVVAAPTASGGYTAYAATVNGGVCRANVPKGTFDDSFPTTSLAWTPLTDNQPSLATASLALDPNDASGRTLWVGTGSVSSDNNNGPPGIGLLVTTDEGATWHVKGNAQLANQQILSVLPTAQTFPGGSEVVLVASRQTGIWWSDNTGDSFQNVVSGAGVSVIEDASNPSWFYAALPGKGVWWSNNDGAPGSWSPVSNTVPMINSGDLRIAAAPGVLYVATISPPTAPPPYGATNLPSGNITGLSSTPITSLGPQLFTAIGTPPRGTEQSVLTANFSYASQFALAVDPTNPDLVYISTSGAGPNSVIFRVNATNGSWTSLASSVQAPDSQPHVDSRSLTVFPGSDNLVETDDGGIYALPNAAVADSIPFVSTSWIALNGDLNDTEFFSVGLDTFHNVVVGGSQDNGTPYQQPPASSSWQLIDGGDGGPVAVDNSPAGGGALYLYSDGTLEAPGPVPLPLSAPLSLLPLTGLTGQDLSAYQAAIGTDTNYPIALDPFTTPKVSEPFFFGMSSLYESYDEGIHIYNRTGFGSTGNVQAIAAGSTSDPLTAYYSTTTGQLFVSNQTTPLDLTGQHIFVGLLPPAGFPPGDTFTRIAIDHQSADTAILLDANNNVYRLTLSTSLSPTWTNITGNLGQVATIVAAQDPSTGKPLQTFENLQSLEVYDPTGSAPVVLAGGLGGVYRGFESGSTFVWSHYGTGLPNALVDDLHYVPANSITGYGDILLAGTLGRGAWSVPHASLTLAEPETLEVVANSGDVIRLALDVSVPTVLDATETNSFHVITDFLTVPLSQITAIQVDATAGNVTLDVDENPGVTEGAGPITIPDPVSPNCALEFNGAASDSLQVDDALDSAPETITLGTDQILGLGMSMCYDSLGRVQFIGGTAAHAYDIYTLTNTDSSVQTRLDLGTGFNRVDVVQTAGPAGSSIPSVTINNVNNLDSVTVGASGASSITLAAGKLANIVGTVEVNGVGGATQAGLVIDDEHDNAPANWAVEGGTSPSNGQPLPNVRWNSGSQNALILFQHITGLYLNGGGGGSVFQLSPSLENLDLLPAFITVNGAALNPDLGKQVTNTLTLDDQHSKDVKVVWNITGMLAQRGTGEVTRSPSGGAPQPLVSFSNIINTDSTKPSLIVNGGAFGNTFKLSPSVENLDELPSYVEIVGGSAADALVVNDQSNPNLNTWKIDGPTMARTRFDPLTKQFVTTSTVLFSSIGTLTVNGSTRNTAFFVGSTVSGTATTIQGGAGVNIFVVGTDGTFDGKVSGVVSALILNGGSGAGNSLVIDDNGNTSYVDGVKLNSTSAVGVTGVDEGFFGAGGNLAFSGFTNVTLNTSDFDFLFGIYPFRILVGARVTVTPQKGMLFTINGTKPTSGSQGNSLIVNSANGGVTNDPGTKPPSFYFTSDPKMTEVVQYTDVQQVSPAGWLVAARDAGTSPEVKVYNAQSGVLRFDITAFDPDFAGGVRVAVGDVNGDGIPDIIVAQGPGDGSKGAGLGHGHRKGKSSGDSLVQVFDGVTGGRLAGPLGSLDPFPGFHCGLNVAAADLTGDGYADLIVGQDAGGHGWVKVYSGQDGSLLAQFRPFGLSFTGGVRLAAGAVTSNGRVDVVAGAGPGGPPLVKVFDGPGLVAGVSTPVASFDAFDRSFRGGVYVAAGLIHGEGQGLAAIIVGEGAGGSPRVSVFDGTGTLVQSFLAFDRGFKGGVRVAAADVNGDGRSDIVAAQGPGPGTSPRVRGFDGVSLQQIDTFLAFSAHARDGLFVAGGGKWGLFNGALTEFGRGSGLPSIGRGRTWFGWRRRLSLQHGLGNLGHAVNRHDHSRPEDRLKRDRPDVLYQGRLVDLRAR